MKKLFSLLLMIIIVLGAAKIVSSQTEVQKILITEIEIRGNKRIDSMAILERIQSKAGDIFSPAKLRDDLRAIYAIGQFDDVQLKVEDFEGGIKVIFSVIERPLIKVIDIAGNKKIKTKDIKDKMDIKVNSLYNPVEIKNNEDKIKTLYETKGFYNIKLTSAAEKIAEGEMKITFNIDEGLKYKIDEIKFEGNKSIPSSKLKKTMKTKEEFLFLWGTLEKKQFDEDLDRIINYYGNFGFLRARIEKHDIKIDESKGKIYITIQIVEGQQFKVGKIDIKGNTVFNNEEIMKHVKIKEGDIFSREKVRHDMFAISEIYGDAGYSFVDINPVTILDTEKLVASITFELKEGKKVYVERINIAGNVKTSEKIIRREMNLLEGDAFSSRKLAKSRQKIFNLGFFEDVHITTLQGSSDEKIIINVEIKERPTGFFSVGAGYSSVDKIVGLMEIAQRNLFGRGQEIFLNIRYGGTVHNYSIGFTEPYLFDIPLSAGFDIYTYDRVYDEYSRKSKGGDIRFNYPLTEDIKGYFTYKLEHVNIYDVSDGASQTIKDLKGKSVTSSTIYSIIRDTRDNIFEPSKGSKNSISLEVAGGILQGTNKFYKGIIESGWYFPLWWNTVLGIKGEAGIGSGYGGKDLPIFERFYLGGPNTIRGLRSRSVGPKDDAGEVIGGKSEILLNIEYIFPIIEKLKGVLFFDAGDAYGYGKNFDLGDIRTSPGIGIRYYTPIGPMRLDWGYNLDKKPGEKAYQWNFSIGTLF